MGKNNYSYQYFYQKLESPKEPPIQVKVDQTIGKNVMRVQQQ